MTQPRILTSDRPPAAQPRSRPLMDGASRDWVDALRSDGSERDRALDSLHQLLLRVARSEAARRRTRLPEHILSDVDDLCVQAASDATMAVIRKLDSFRGAARFTTWASKFAILEVSTRLRRRAWRDRDVRPDERVWDRLADSRPGALQGIEQRELLAAVRRAARHHLTERQLLVFESALDEVPIDVLAERLGSTRGAIYKTLHDARRKLRTVLTNAGYLESSVS